MLRLALADIMTDMRLADMRLAADNVPGTCFVPGMCFTVFMKKILFTRVTCVYHSKLTC